MSQLIENVQLPERALLVGVQLSNVKRSEAEDSLSELERLADTAGVEVVGKVIQHRNRLDPAYYIGEGKAQEIADICKQSNLSLVIFDSDLSPAQTRNLEEKIGIKVIDRTRLILDIFALHARTKEAMLEVELAQLAYQLPRLTRLWTHLSRQSASAQRGGVGMRGPGEKQLEIDKRLIRNRISTLKRALDKVKENRKLERKNRADKFTVALVGYTNAGKSTLLNALADEDLYTDDKLFATLDPVTRIVRLSEHHEILMTDTVGFIRKLPHHLIASFRATLEEVNEADMLVHVADASHPNVREQMLAVNEVLEELGAVNSPVLVAFNKIDKLNDAHELISLKNTYPNSVGISALTGQGLDELKSKILQFVSENEIDVDIDLPQYEGKLINYIYEHGIVTKREIDNDMIHIHARMNQKYLKDLEPYTSPVKLKR